MHHQHRMAPGAQRAEDEARRTLFVGNLPTDVTSESLGALFPGAEQVAIDVKAGRFAFVRMPAPAQHDAVLAAAAAAPLYLHGCKLRVRARHVVAGPAAAVEPAPGSMPCLPDSRESLSAQLLSLAATPAAPLAPRQQLCADVCFSSSHA